MESFYNKHTGFLNIIHLNKASRHGMQQLLAGVLSLAVIYISSRFNIMLANYPTDEEVPLIIEIFDLGMSSAVFGLVLLYAIGIFSLVLRGSISVVPFNQETVLDIGIIFMTNLALLAMLAAYSTQFLTMLFAVATAFEWAIRKKARVYIRENYPRLYSEALKLKEQGKL